MLREIGLWAFYIEESFDRENRTPGQKRKTEESTKAHELEEAEAPQRAQKMESMKADTEKGMPHPLDCRSLTTAEGGRAELRDSTLQNLCNLTW
jgi:hypothetical protein